MAKMAKMKFFLAKMAKMKFLIFFFINKKSLFHIFKNFFMAKMKWQICNRPFKIVFANFTQHQIIKNIIL